jgi:hypothetical protein
VLQWRVYGSAGFRNREAGLTLERFTKCRQHNSRIVKSLVRLRDVALVEVHIPRRLNGRVTDVVGRTVENVHSNHVPWLVEGPARINHYISRSWEEFESKRARGRGAVVGAFREADAFDRAGPGAVERLDALRYVPAVREEVARLRKIVDAG